MRAGSQPGFEEYAAARGLSLLRLAVMLTGTSTDAEDVLQATYERLIRHWDRVSRADQPHAYARRVLVNEFLQWKRRPSRRESPHDLLPEIAAREATASTGADDEAWLLLATLPRQQRATLVLRYYEDLPDARIAEILGCSEGTVRSNASRGLATLRSTLRSTLHTLQKEVDP